MAPSARLTDRRRKHDELSARLAALSDDELTALLASVEWRSGWGETGIVKIDGAKVFAKRISLADRERTSADDQPTANVFDLPLFYQYGIGSAGFGAWRELQAQMKASAWALEGACAYFPVVYHWRVLPRTSQPMSVMRARVDELVTYWNGSEAVRGRLSAMADASAAIVVFMEYVPESLRAWLARAVKEGRDGAELDAVIARVIEQLRAATVFMNAHGMLHFDLHAQNLLTDGADLYVCDFGLATCDAFALSPSERAFFEMHQLYDRAYIEWAILNALPRAADTPIDWLATEPDLPRMSSTIRALVEPYLPAARVMGAFFVRLRADKTTRFPATELAAAMPAH